MVSDSLPRAAQTPGRQTIVGIVRASIQGEGDMQARSDKVSDSFRIRGRSPWARVFAGCLVILLSMGVAHAQSGNDEAEADPAAPPPIPPIDAAPRTPEGDVPIPPKVQDEDAMIEPTVEIRRGEDDSIVEEYSLDGRVYMVKITPKNGIPYYYLDDDGDGSLELRERDRAAHPVKPVYWKVKEW